MAQNPQLDQLLLRLLGSVALFEGMDRSSLVALLAMSQRSEFAQDEVLFAEGDNGNCMYIIISGLVEVFRKPAGAEPIQLSTAGPGETVGEMALIERLPRTAGVRALAPTVTLQLSRSVLSSQLQLEAALYRNIARMLAQRLRRNNDTLTALTLKAQPPTSEKPATGARPEGTQAPAGKSPST